MPYRIDPNTGQPVWDGTSIPQASRDSLSAQIRSLQDQIDDFSFIDLDDAPTTYTGQAGKIVAVNSAEDGLEFVVNSGGGGGVSDGDKGDVVVSSSGAVWTIDTSAVTNTKIASDAITTAKILDGAVTVAKTSGFGSIATQASSSVTITGGSITGITDLAIADGGTGASSASAARSNLGLGGAAVLNVGTTTGTVAAGDDSRFHNAVTIDTTLSSVIDISDQDLVAVTIPAADRIVFFDQSEGSWEYLEVGSGLSISGQTLTATAGSGDVVGPASSTDHAIALFDGTGGKTLINSSIVIDDPQVSPVVCVTMRVNQSGQTNSPLNLSPMGNGAFILGPKPDNTLTGGAARGANAVDLQMTRANAAHVASGAGSFVGVGIANAATASNSATVGGLANQATAAQACAHGVRGLANRLNMMAHGNATALGECQAGRVIMRRITTDETPVPLSMDGAAPTGAAITTSTHFVLLNNQAVFADIRVAARSASGTDHAAFMRRVLIKRDANIASTAIIGSVISPSADIKSAGASGWEVAITAEASSVGGMLITVTGAATTIVWGATVEFIEIIRA